MVKKAVFQFRISLQDITPDIWRRIQVPENYSFWDLHVAIQDSMGWLDYHLHQFKIDTATNETITIGIPPDDFDDDDEYTEPGWKVRIAKYFKRPGDSAYYEYDFGDNWAHEILFEGILLAEKGVKYPQCIAGERACPPEDCHGAYGYERLLEILADRSHEEYREMVEWLKGHAKNYYPFKPEHFDPKKVRFDDPHERWNKAFPDYD